MDHDRLFKELLTTFFGEFLELFLPEISAAVVRDSFEFLDKEVFSDVTAGEKYEADLVVKARLQDADAFFLVHVENQAKAQPDFGRRMFRYFARLHERHGLPVYPVVIFSYDTPRRPEPDRYRVSFPDRTVLDFRFRVVQLNRLSWRRFVQQPNPVASALMAKMHIRPEDRPKVKLECLRLLATLRLDPARSQLISGFVDSYLRLSAPEQRVFDRRLAAIAPPEREATMELMTSWKEEGLSEGLQQGLTQGLQQGLTQGLQQGLTQGLQQGLTQGLQQEASALTRRQLRRRFGLLPEALDGQIQRLPRERLEDLAEALLDFTALADVETWLAGQDV